jgi:hypothetical protein
MPSMDLDNTRTALPYRFSQLMKVNFPATRYLVVIVCFNVVEVKSLQVFSIG